MCNINVYTWVLSSSIYPTDKVPCVVYSFRDLFSLRKNRHSSYCTWYANESNWDNKKRIKSRACESESNWLLNVQTKPLLKKNDSNTFFCNNIFLQCWIVMIIDNTTMPLIFLALQLFIYVFILSIYLFI